MGPPLMFLLLNRTLGRSYSVGICRNHQYNRIVSVTIVRHVEVRNPPHTSHNLEMADL